MPCASCSLTLSKSLLQADSEVSGASSVDVDSDCSRSSCFFLCLLPRFCKGLGRVICCCLELSSTGSWCSGTTWCLGGGVPSTSTLWDRNLPMTVDSPFRAGSGLQQNEGTGKRSNQNASRIIPIFKTRWCNVERVSYLADRLEAVRLPIHLCLEAKASVVNRSVV